MEIDNKKPVLINFDLDILSALDREAQSQKRSRTGQLEIILRERYEMPLQSAQNGRAAKKRNAA